MPARKAPTARTTRAASPVDEGVFAVPAPAGSLPKNRFHFRMPDGAKHSVPQLQYVSGAGAEFIDQAVEDGADEVRLCRGLMAIEDAAAGEAVRTLANDQVLELSRAWIAAGSVTPGK